MDALSREDRIWSVQAAVAQDLDALTAWQVALALEPVSPAQQRQLAASNAAAILLREVIPRAVASNTPPQKLRELLAQQPFTKVFTNSQGIGPTLDSLLGWQLTTPGLAQAFESELSQ